MARLPTALILVCLLVLGLTAAPAGAKDVVIIDPSSPAAREYAVPLYDGRSVGNEKASRDPRHPPPIFGQGIDKASPPRPQVAVPRRTIRPITRRRAPRRPQRAVARPAKAAAFEVGSASGPSSGLIGGAAVGAVLAAALLTVGLMRVGVRRRRG